MGPNWGGQGLPTQFLIREVYITNNTRFGNEPELMGCYFVEGRMMKKFTYYLFIAMLSVSVANASPSMTDNGSLDDDVLSALFELFGWDVHSSRVTPVGSHTAPGDSYIDLSQYETYSVTFDTEIGQTYMLLFDMSGLPTDDRATVSLLLEALGQSQEFTMNVSESTADELLWLTQSWGFEADDLQTTFTFSSLSAYLDNIRLYAVQAVPVPGAILLIGFGLTGTLGLKRRLSR